ncbi:MAG: hypothetical protein EA404_11985 [Spirochaetaceae bacterium]|nr:MAG: hypothetical protein EA404_11985 [Spirochaetaceae bacterium]
MIRTAFAGLVALLVIASPALAEDWGGDDWDDWNDWGDADAVSDSRDSHEWESGGWAASPDVSLSGYLETTGLAVLPRVPGRDSTHLGLQTLLRLRGRFEPATRLSVTLETELIDRRGATHPAIRAGIMGVPTDPDTDSADSRQIHFDYLYGSAAFGAVDFRVGRQPLAWGTAYALNPTDLMNPASLAGLAGVEPPGITALSAGLTPGARWGLEGYLGFEDRSRHPTALEDLTGIDALPFGMRARAFIGMWDFALGMARATEFDRVSTLHVDEYLTAEASGSIGELLLYGEAALDLSVMDNNWSRTDRYLDTAVGVQWDLLDNLSLQAEYHRRGAGATDPDEYSIADRLQGRLTGRDYLAGIGNFSLRNDTIRLTMAALGNLRDRSYALLPEMTWSVVDDFQLALGGSVFLGPSDSEFDGRVSNGNSGEIDTGRPQIYARATWYF